MNEVEEVIKELKTNPGFSAYVIMNNDGKDFHRILLICLGGFAIARHPVLKSNDPQRLPET